ncbi:MAG: protein kinase [Nannocystis sp.]|nr:protein kinase [Nannocystis sp.]
MDVDETPATRPHRSGDGEASAELRPAMMLGRYTVLGVLGRGGMGVVYSGLDPQLRRRVAIKQITRRSGDEQGRQRSLREAQALARLAHPNIVTVHEAFEVEGRLCIAMELVVGETLRAWLASEPRSQAAILEALEQAGQGIAAAHAAGLVHRDLKPDNIMIGADGRVRVMDFGLARAVEAGDLALEIDAGVTANDALTGPMTRVGALIGTPGYVAPEQQLGLAADARSDVFSFCVLAFEALYGARPFQGRDEAAICEAAQAGRVVATPGDTVPAWLSAVIRRGLAAQPARRWPTMEALLEALGRDPIARRRQRLRSAASLVVAGAVVAIAAVGVGALREANARARREEAASARLEAVEATIARAEAEGDAAAAEAAFRTFVADPDHLRTRALTRAWLARGDRRQGAPAQAAYAEAYVHARTPEDEAAALRRLSGVFSAEWDGVGLSRSVGLLRARGVEDPALARLGFHAALWQRDLAGAAAELRRADHPQAGWAPMLERLGRARELPIAANEIVALPAGGPARLALLQADRKAVVVLDEALRERERVRSDGLMWLAPGTSWVVEEREAEVAVIDVLSRAVLGRGGPMMGPFVAFDATGDGAPELFFGRKWPLYGFYRWDGIGGAGISERAAHAGTDASDSTFDGRVVGDLDGDGTQELVIAFGPWNRFDLRVFRGDAQGELELLAARLVGRMGGMTIVRRGERRWLAVLVDNSCPAPDVFPTPPHTGAAPGVYFFEWRDGRLEEVAAVAIPGGESLGRFVGQEVAVAGDFDGDGPQDLAFSLKRDQSWSLLLRQTAQGFEPLMIAGMRVIGGVQLDEDPELELVARTTEQTVLVLGLGDAVAPPIPQAKVEAPPVPPALRDPALVERWGRANDLAALAQLESAAVSLRDGAVLAGERAAKSALLDRAGALFASAALPRQVLALDTEVHDDPLVRGRAQARRAQALASLGRYVEALAEAQALLALRGKGAAEEEIARALVDDLSVLVEGEAQIEARFDAPLVDSWRFMLPGAVRRDPSRSALTLVLPATGEPAAMLPIDWHGGPIALEFELDLARVEFGACVEISIVDPQGQPWLGGAVCGQGGGGQLWQVVWQKSGEVWWNLTKEHPVASAQHGRTVTMRAAYLPQRGQVLRLWEDDGEMWTGKVQVTAPPAQGRHHLVLSSVDSSQLSLARAALRGLRIRGAQLASMPEPTAGERAAWLFAENEPRAALAALSNADEGATLRLLAMAELGDLGGAAAAAAAVLGGVAGPPRRGALALALRHYPLAAAALRAAGGGALLPTLQATWAFAYPHRNDPELRAEILGGMRDVELLTPTNEAERAALRALLEVRAELWARSGEAIRAGRDRAAAAELGLF